MPRMAPVSTPRQLWMWSLPSLVVLLSLVWYKRKRNTLRSDPGGTSKLLPDAAESDHQDIDGEEVEVKASHPPVLVHSESACEGDSTISEVDAETTSVINSVESVETISVTESTSATNLSLVDLDVTASKETTHLAETHKADTSATVNPEALCHFSAETIEEKLEESEKEVAVLCEAAPTSESVEVVQIAENREALSIPSNSEEAEEINSKQLSPAVSEEEEVSITVSMKGAKEGETTMAPSNNAKNENDKVAALEGKLASLALSSTEEQRRGAERDSANHSPVDAMLASPSMSSYSDEHSEGSSDSGKGCSDVASPPSRTPVGSGSLAGDADVDTGVESTSTYSVYEFLLPQLLVGRLIGRHGTFVHEIKTKTNATIWIKKHPDTTKHKICSIEGTSPDIDSALAMIRHRFPPNKYPSVTLEQISVAPTPTTFPLVPDFCQLHLVEGVNNEVMISSLVSPAHMFVQQPYHPSYQFLQRLNQMMNSVYANVETPNLPDPIEGGNICVAPAIDGWYRAQVVSSNEEAQTSEIKFVDYGGYMSVNNSVLRQIRQDFMTLPFQATECYLANIKPSGESGEWSLDALRIVEELTRGQMLLAQVYDYAADGVPLIYLYSSVNSQVVLINQELVARGMADLDDSVVSSQTSEAASLVVAAKAVAAAVAVETPTEDSAASSTTTESEEKPAAVEPSSPSKVAAVGNENN